MKEKEAREIYEDYVESGGTMRFWPWARYHLADKGVNVENMADTGDSNYSLQQWLQDEREKEGRKSTHDQYREDNPVKMEDIVSFNDREQALHNQYKVIKERTPGVIRVHEVSFGKMHKLETTMLFCIKGGNIHFDHWYEIIIVNEKTKTLTLRSLQTNKVYDWKYKGGKHFVIPIVKK